MRRMWLSARWKSSLALEVSPLDWMSAPTSVLRAVMTPSKGGYHFFKRFQLLEPAHIGLSGVDEGAFRGEVGDRLVPLLDGDRLRFEEALGAGGVELREIQIGLRVLEVGARLFELLVDFGRLDFSQDVALLHRAPMSVFQLLR